MMTSGSSSATTIQTGTPKVQRIPLVVEVFSGRVFDNGFDFLTSRPKPSQFVLGVA
jgi:hypothetical protein